MGLTPRAIAEDASFHAFINAYLREVDAGLWLDPDHWRDQGFPFTLQGSKLLQLELPDSKQRLVFDVAYQSNVGRHHFFNVYQQDLSHNSPWQIADPLYVQIDLIKSIYQQQQKLSTHCSKSFSEQLKHNEMELLSRLVDSHQQMSHYLEARHSDERLKHADFLASEQSALYGHWLHPTPKSRQGMASWQQGRYSPELEGRFKLHYFSVNRSLVIEGSVLKKSTSDILLAELRQYESVQLATDHVLIPVHPLQAHYLLLQDWVRELLANNMMRYLSEMGAMYTPTSSVRTLFNANSEWMLKFSIPVKITNSLRTNMRDELEDGMEVEKYLRKSGFLDERPEFKMVDDPAFIGVKMPGNEDLESGFEVVLRRNLFGNLKGKDNGQGICSILALAQAPFGVKTADCQKTSSLLKQIIEDLAKKESRPEKAVALDWFNAYWHCAIESLFVLYDRYGIALEAHQQNSLLDVSNGYPSCYYYRDNQGFYLSRRYSATLNEVHDKLTMSEMFYDDDKIFRAISYYLLINQLFAIIYRLGADGLISEAELISQCQQHLSQLKTQMTGVGKQLIEHILERPELSAKTNLMARVNDIDELHEGMEHSVYNTVPNPLFAGSANHLSCASPVQAKGLGLQAQAPEFNLDPQQKISEKDYVA